MSPAPPTAPRPPAARVEPRLRVGQLRGGLHALIVALALVVALRAVLLSQPHAPIVALLVAAFIGVYLIGALRRPSGIVQALWLALLAALWLALDLLGSDAAYISLALVLLAFIELPLPWAAAAAVAITAADIAIGLGTGAGAGTTLLGPLLGAVIAVLIGLGFRVLLAETERRQDLIDELRRTRTALAAQERAAGETAERERLAREIHDTIAQGLGSIHMLLQAAENDDLPPRAGERVVLARTTAAAALADARRLVAALAPADLTARSLTEALTRVCDRSRVPARLVVEGPARPLAMPIESALVRICQGALANVALHADAHEAVVSLTHTDRRVHLDIVDDGHGFDVAIIDDTRARNFGLRTMRHRVEELNGRWHLESHPGHTAVSVSFAIDEGSGEE